MRVSAEEGLEQWRKRDTHKRGHSHPIESLNRTTSWGTTAMALRTDSIVYDEMSLPPRRIDPPSGA